MSQVLINQTDQDLIEVDFFQHGQNHTETTLDQEILNGEKSYHFCVSSLSVPLKHVPIHPVTETTQLFRVRRRFTGQVVNRNDREAAVYAIYKEIVDLGAQPPAGMNWYGPLQTLTAAIGGQPIMDSMDLFFDNAPGGQLTPNLTGWSFTAQVSSALRVWAMEYVERQSAYPILDPAIAVFSVSPSRPMYSVSQFLLALQQYCERLNRNLTETGLDNHSFGLPGGGAVAPVVIANEGDILRYLDISSSCDGSVLFKPGANFFQYYTIEFSAYGASLLGIPLSDLFELEGGYYLCPTGDSYSTTPFAGYDWAASANTDDVIFTAHHPIFSTADQRIKISVSSHLPILSNVLINNEKQSSDRDITEAFFENSIKSEIHYTDGVLGTRLTSKVYSGQVNMIKKHSQFHQWNKLITSYRLRYMRFYLFVTYRDYQIATNKFVLRKIPVTVEDQDYWSFSIKFVSDA